MSDKEPQEINVMSGDEFLEHLDEMLPSEQEVRKEREKVAEKKGVEPEKLKQFNVLKEFDGHRVPITKWLTEQEISEEYEWRPEYCAYEVKD